MDNTYREGYIRGMEDAFKLAKEEIGRHAHAMICGSGQSQYWKMWEQKFSDKFDSALAAIKEGE